MNKTEIASFTVAYLEQWLAKERSLAPAPDSSAQNTPAKGRLTKTDLMKSTLSLDEIANRIGYSKFYLNRVFQEQLQTTIHQYLLERRLTEAAKNLVQTDKPIIDIAYEAGYQSQQAFTNAFTSLYLCAPLKYRLERNYAPLRPPYQPHCLASLTSFPVRSRLEAA